MNSLIRSLAFSLVAALPAFPQNGAAPNSIDYEAIRLTKIATAIRITDEISVDGYLDEPAWRVAVPLTDFIQRVPNTGRPSSGGNDVRFLYDDDNLYVGFFAYDPEIDKMGVNELREDFGFGENDATAVVIDGLHDRRSGFIFTTNPEGAKRDGQISNDGQSNFDWDGVWDVKVSRNEQGWIAEYVIPFKTLRFPNAPVQEWGMNLSRRMNRLNEESNWSPVQLRYTGTRVSAAGVLNGIENISPGRNLKVKPFVTGGVTQVRNALRNEMDTLRSLTRLKDYDGGLDAKYSLSPQLTLDATYHTDFAQVEVDQQQVNLTRFNLFFPEKRDFFLENSGIFSFGPGGNLVPFFSRAIGLSGGTPVPIVGGARVSGRVNRYDVGVLSMKTEEATLPNGAVTPSSNYAVARVKRNLFTNSWFGGLVTHRDSSGGGHNEVYGADAHFQFSSRLEFDSYIIRSNTSSAASALGHNQARRFQTGWRDDELTISAEYNEVQPNFNPEVGFIRRRDMEQYSGDFAWRPLLRNNDVIRNLTFASAIDYFAGSGSGKVETRGQDFTVGMTFENNGSVNFITNRTFDRLAAPFRIRPDISIPSGDYTYVNYTANFNTGQARRFSGTGSVNWGEFWTGDRKSFSGAFGARVNQHLNIDLDYSHNRVTLAAGKFTTDLMGARFQYALTARAFLNAYFQYNADTHQVSSNIRFNFTHRPLSDVYLVYNDRRDTDAGELVERAFIIKLTNLFNF